MTETEVAGMALATTTVCGDVSARNLGDVGDSELATGTATTTESLKDARSLELLEEELLVPLVEAVSEVTTGLAMAEEAETGLS